MVRGSGVSIFTMREIDELGMRIVMERAITLASQGTAGFVVSFDMDVVDPEEAPGVGTPVRGGHYLPRGASGHGNGRRQREDAGL